MESVPNESVIPKKQVFHKELSFKVIGCAQKVHRVLGSGFPEGSGRTERKPHSPGDFLSQSHRAEISDTYELRYRKPRNPKSGSVNAVTVFMF